jgi:hypothetical protein
MAAQFVDICLDAEDIRPRRLSRPLHAITQLNLGIGMRTVASLREAR